MGGLGATYDVHLRLIGKLVGDFLLVIIELFSLGAFGFFRTIHACDGQTDGPTDTFAVGKTALHICSAVKIVKIQFRSNPRWRTRGLSLIHI